MAKEEIVLKVSAKSNANSVAGSIAKNTLERKQVFISAVGAGALNQAVKACAISRGYVGPSGYDLALVPAFDSISIDGEARTAIKFKVIEL
jgi:stage V sporulation protein S